MIGIFIKKFKLKIQTLFYIYLKNKIKKKIPYITHNNLIAAKC